MLLLNKKKKSWGKGDVLKWRNTTEFRKLHWNEANERKQTTKANLIGIIGRYKCAKQLLLKDLK